MEGYDAMKKIFIFTLVSSVAVMLFLPYMAVSIVNGDAGMAACFILFYAVNPIYSVIAGFYAGKDIKHLWGLPVISALLFLFGAWIFFDAGEMAFIMYAAVYLALGIAAMLVSKSVNRKAQRKNFSCPAGKSKT